MRIFEICTPQQQLALLQRIVANTWQELAKQSITQLPTKPAAAKQQPKPKRKLSRKAKPKPMRSVPRPPRSQPKPKPTPKPTANTNTADNTTTKPLVKPRIKPVPPVAVGRPSKPLKQTV